MLLMYKKIMPYICTIYKSLHDPLKYNSFIKNEVKLFFLLFFFLKISFWLSRLFVAVGAFLWLWWAGATLYLWFKGFSFVGFPHSSVGKGSACKAGDPGEGIGYLLQYSWASLVAQLVKNLPVMWETWVYPWMAKIPWRKERLPTPVF